MAWTKYQLFLAALMIITGSINTLATKWADDSVSKGRDNKIKKFNHPFLQAVAMFLGEFLCFLVYKLMFRYYMRRNDNNEEELPDSIKGNRKFNPFIFMIPALCDMTATSIMYIGLNMTSSSSFQMLRGALIIFTGIFSIIFRKRRLRLYHWIGMFLVTGGLVIVGKLVIIDLALKQLLILFLFFFRIGLSDMLSQKDNSEKNNSTIGNILIMLAQLVVATQMIVEEKYVSDSNVSSLHAVGWEGIFGFTILSILLVPMYFIKIGGKMFETNPEGQIEDAIDGFYQIFNSWEVACGISGTILSIAFFNFAGISVTKQLSATTRTVLDSVRTIIIWMFSLAIREESFSFYKLGGFFVLLIGMAIYNEVFNGLCRKRSESLVIDDAEGEEVEAAYSQDIIS
ncbi:transmembrane protein C2orf18-like protein [Euroglyphus maynei]|uniref:Transmembrane protein C2orf18-like protein n=1 Tax=Euroglyphus maynei TaxID=6958 RepID=A0A1Y3B0L9_EURMA|nr:transmembrane protein C2orf18-like protein [Euroglyphus maynei]